MAWFASAMPWGQVIVLWNTATKQAKYVGLSGTKPIKGINSQVSMGFGFDSIDNDFKVLSIFCFVPGFNIPDSVGVYSVKGEYWKKLKINLGFRITGSKCEVVVKGVPYWVALVNDVLGFRHVLVYFEMGNETFHQLPMPTVARGTTQCIGELQDSLGMAVWKENENSYFDVWIMDDESCWSKMFTVGPILGVDRVVGFSRDGEIVMKNKDDSVMLYDLDAGGTGFISIDGSVNGNFEVFNHTESLFFIKGRLTTNAEAHKKISTARETLMNRFGFTLKMQSIVNPLRYNIIGCPLPGAGIIELS